MTPNYHTIETATVNEIKPIKKSRFIAHLIPFANADNLETYLNSLKQQYPNANHHCWAYHILHNNQIRFSDDGEPSGSAGKPILNHLSGNKLINTCLIVSRIFGGIKLGVGGLVRAYGQAASAVINNSKLIPFIPKKCLSFTYQYEHTSLIEQALHALKLTPSHSIFGERITLSFEISVTLYDVTIQSLIEMTQSKIIII